MQYSETWVSDDFVCPGFSPEGGRWPDDPDPFIPVPIGFDTSRRYPAMSVQEHMALVQRRRGTSGRRPVEELSM